MKPTLQLRAEMAEQALNWPGSGIAKRTAFENTSDVEHFLSVLEMVVDAGLVEVHAYAILTTHFHLLLRSLMGDLPRAIQRLTLRYVRWFNRSRKRDGSLFRGRYKARLIEDDVYWECVVRYIDLNPVRAKLCARPSEYPFGSATLYGDPTRPQWLSTADIETSVAAWSGRGAFNHADYDDFALSADGTSVAQIVERGLSTTLHARTVPLTQLVHAASRRQRQWFEWKAGLADGSLPGHPIVTLDGFDRIVGRLPDALRSDQSLNAGLLRELCGASYQEIADRLASATSTAFSGVRAHEKRCRTDASYRAVVARIVDRLVLSTVPIPSRSVLSQRRA